MSLKLFDIVPDFTPVCTTELGSVARLKPEIDKRGARSRPLPTGSGATM